MPKALDITGQRFGKLVALEKAPSRKGKTYWLCQCDCGNTKEIQTGHLTSGVTTSCGCGCPSIRNKGQKVIDFRVRIKKALVEANGHKCAYCGLVDDPVIYDFHHIDPSTKLFGLASGDTKSRQRYADEAKKCVMLCAICHRKVENGLIPNDFVSGFNEQIYYETLEALKQGDK